MSDAETLRKLCYDEKGAVKSKPECRASIINHLILEEMIDIDEAEDLAEKTLRESDLWPEEPPKKDIHLPAIDEKPTT